MASSKKRKKSTSRRQQRSRRRREKPVVAPKPAHAFVDELFGQDMHAARVASLANATTGTLQSAALSIHAIGRGLAAVKGLVDKWNDIEDELLLRFGDAVPAGVRVIIAGDRGFGDPRFYAWLPEELNFDDVLRIRGDILVTSRSGDCRQAAAWVGKGGRMPTLDGALVTKDESRAERFIAVRDEAMADSWCLVVSSVEWTGSEVKKRCG